MAIADRQMQVPDWVLMNFASPKSDLEQKITWHSLSFRVIYGWLLEASPAHC